MDAKDLSCEVRLEVHSRASESRHSGQLALLYAFVAYNILRSERSVNNPGLLESQLAPALSS